MRGNDTQGGHPSLAKAEKEDVPRWELARRDQGLYNQVLDRLGRPGKAGVGVDHAS